MTQTNPATKLLRLAKKAFHKAIYESVDVIVFQRKGIEVQTSEYTLTSIDKSALAKIENSYTLRIRPLIDSRFKNSDQCILLKKGAELLHIAWIGYRKEITASYEIGEELKIPTRMPSIVIYDCWTPETARGHGAYKTILNLISSDPKTDYWIYCLSTNKASEKGILKAGFKASHIMNKRCFFGIFKKRSLKELR